MRILLLLVYRTAPAIIASMLAVPFAAFAQPTNVFTWHNDIARTGQNLRETILTTGNVKPSNFGLRYQFPVDGKVDAQPLYVSTIEMPPNGSHNVVFVATEHDSVYAFDADTGQQFWKVSLLGNGETPSDDRGCGQVTPEIGVTATPVIVRRAWYDGSLYVVAMSKDTSGNYYQRIHALNLWDGSEQFGGPTDVAATVAGTGDNSSNGTVVFDPKQYKERAALLAVGSNVFTSWGSHCDIRPYTGWSIGYDQTTLAQTVVYNFAPNGSGASVWNSGAGPAADPAGNIFYAVGNGTFDTTLTRRGFPNQDDFGNSLVVLNGNNSLLKAWNYWTMYNTVAESRDDKDLGSGGVMLLPYQVDSTGKARRLAVAAGKDSNLYVVERYNLGKFDPNSNGTLYQELDSALPNGVFGGPAYYNGQVYYGSAGSQMRAFTVDQARLVASPSSTTATNFQSPGTTPSISAYNTSNGIAWAVENADPAVLHAYDASDLGVELYNSSQAADGRDHFGPGNKFIVPTIANGKVFVGTQNSVAVFGLLPQQTPPPIPDGLYNVINHASGLLLNDPVSSTLNDTTIIQFPQAGSVNEHWLFSYQGSGYYVIANASSGLLLTDPNGETTAGTPLIQHSPLYNDWQLWSLIPNGTGYVIQNKATGLVLDDPVGNAAPGPIDLWVLVSTNPPDEAFYTNDIWTIEQAH